ncbi:unnamed protein product, partial [Onchocerca ochengi]
QVERHSFKGTINILPPKHSNSQVKKGSTQQQQQSGVPKVPVRHFKATQQ